MSQVVVSNKDSKGNEVGLSKRKIRSKTPVFLPLSQRSITKTAAQRLTASVGAAKLRGLQREEALALLALQPGLHCIDLVSRPPRNLSGYLSAYAPALSGGYLSHRIAGELGLRWQELSSEVCFVTGNGWMKV